MSHSPVTVRTTCRLCGSPNLSLAVPLASVPIISPNVSYEQSANETDMLAVSAPLDNYLCQDCGLIQLIHVVDPGLIYRDYLYRTAVSKGLADHFHRLAEAVIRRAGLDANSRVVEFGSNDGTLLRFFKQAGMNVQGVDPAASIAAEATARRIPTIADFFGPDLAQRMRTQNGPAAAIISNNCMANIDGLGAILAGVELLLDDNGVFVFETQYALDVFEKFLLDVIYHEHISCFSVEPLAKALPKYGLEILDAEPIATKGGSIRFWIQKRGGPGRMAPRVEQLITQEREVGLYDPDYLARFGQRVSSLRLDLHRKVDAVRSKSGRIAAYGTSVGCAALLHQLELQDKVGCLFDDTPFKPHLSGPGYRLPVYKGDLLSEHRPDLVIILAWRYAEDIVAKHSGYLNGGGCFIAPLPSLLEYRQ